MIKQKILVSAFLALASIALLIGCGKKDKEEDAALSASPASSQTLTTKAPLTPAPTPAPLPEAVVTQTVSYYFPDIDGISMLYVAFEVENTGQAALVLENVHVKFNTGKKTVEGDFPPMQYQDDIIHSGQKSTFAVWYPYNKEKDLSFESPITAEVSLTPVAAESERIPRSLVLSDLRLIHNYPLFPTVSCAVKNPGNQRDFSLALVYVSMYDENEKLLGVWHFIKNTSVPMESRRNLVEHMHSLPLPDIAERSASLSGRAIGIE